MPTRRRLLLQLASGGFCIPSATAAERPKVIGILNAYVPADVRRFLDSFDREMAQLGHMKGTHYVTVERMAEGRLERLRAMAEELVRMNVDLILAAPSNAVVEAQRATATIPIVFSAVTDPVRQGFVESLARPGRNLTGVSNNAGELGPKRLELLRQMVPRLARLGVLATARTPTYPANVEVLRTAAEALGWRIAVFEAELPLNLSATFAGMTAFRPDALYVAGDANLWSHRRQLAALALQARLPTMFAFAEHVEDGGLMSYGADPQDGFRQSAAYVDRIFKGARPGDLPVQQPSKIDLVINERTAEALGLRIPAALRLQAERIIG